MSILETLSTTLPVILLVCLGIIIRRVGLIRPESVGDIKKLIVNLTLPLLLFKAFATMQFEMRYMLIVGIVFTACTAVMFAVSRLRFVPGLNSKYAPYLMTGFEAGMLGYALFSSIYGDAAIPKFAVIDLGQVLFVFLILIPRLGYDQNQKTSIKETALSILKTPVIIAIGVGVLFNLLGLYHTFYTMPIMSSFLHGAEMISGLTATLVALVIGYELNFQIKGLPNALQTCGIRLATWVLLAAGLNFFILRGVLGLDRTFEAAVMIMAVLPAPFVIPLYLQEGEQVEQEAILNVLSLGIVIALLGSMIVKLLY